MAKKLGNCYRCSLANELAGVPIILYPVIIKEFKKQVKLFLIETVYTKTDWQEMVL